jgi:thymidylate kinase
MNFILIDGIPGSWKTTLLSYIQKHHRVVHQKIVGDVKNLQDIIKLSLKWRVFLKKLLKNSCLKEVIFSDIHPRYYDILSDNDIYSMEICPKKVFFLQIDQETWHKRMIERRNEWYLGIFFETIFSEKLSQKYTSKILQFYEDNGLEVVFLDGQESVRKNYQIILSHLEAE